MVDSSSVNEKNRLGGLERPDDDFPFFRGQPLSLSGGQWAVILAAVAIGFACLTVNDSILADDLGVFVRTLLFPAIPLLALRLVAGPHWRSLFRRLHRVDLAWMLGIAVVNLVITILLGFLVLKLFGADINGAVVGLVGQSAMERELFFLRSLPQLFGEEVLTILPFLFVLHVAHDRLGLSRTQSVLMAWLLSSVLFGLVHLPSYQWNLIQCLVVIGSARLILSLAYIKTKNIWVSTGAHIINDWLIFGFVILASAPDAVA